MSLTLREQLVPLLRGTRRGCEKKAGYASEDLANRVLVKRIRATHEQLYCYQCPHCRLWHLTKLEQHS